MNVLCCPPPPPERSETEACICNQRALRADNFTAAATVPSQPTVCMLNGSKIKSVKHLKKNKKTFLTMALSLFLFLPTAAMSLPQEVEVSVSFVNFYTVCFDFDVS